MSEHESRASRVAARRSWQMILATALMAGAAWLATSSALRALAQGTSPPEAPATAPPAAGGATDESNEAEDVTRRAPAPKASEDEAPEFRESADNNISFPIDI
jgi:hypothetical protein